VFDQLAHRPTLPELLDLARPKEFVELSTEELREMARKTDGGLASWSDWTRDMLLAFHHNRHGKCVP
jgi:hypothetical protein